jgi:hypothetical protein
MATILDRYGVKEVMDGTFYQITEDGNIGAPVLYLDSLKVSTVEQTAENTSARGGKGNVELVSWDFNKEITVTLEDALFSAKSLAIMYGSVNTDGEAVIDNAETIYRTFRVDQIEDGKVQLRGGKEFTLPTEEGKVKYYTAAGVASTQGASDAAYVTVVVDGKTIQEIDISPDTFPGNYAFIGDTYIRSEITGRDEAFQVILPKVKMQSEVTLTLEADGDPTTFNMNLKVLRPAKGPMMKLVKYDL